jgi:hypothetical protein
MLKSQLLEIWNVPRIYIILQGLAGESKRKPSVKKGPGVGGHARLSKESHQSAPAWGGQADVYIWW